MLGSVTRLGSMGLATMAGSLSFSPAGCHAIEAATGHVLSGLFALAGAGIGIAIANPDTDLRSGAMARLDAATGKTFSNGR